MDTNSIQENQDGRKAYRWRRILLPLAALALGWLIFGAWLTGLAASQNDPSAALQNGLLAPSDLTLSITKSSSPLTFTVGTGNKYIIRVSATGTISGATQIKVEDTLPNGLTIESLEFNSETWDCIYSSSELFCDFIDVIDPPEILPAIVVNVDIASTVTPFITNTVNLYTDGGVIPTDDDELVTPVDSVDLDIQKRVEPTYADVGEIVTYTLVVNNYGPFEAREVEVIDQLPYEAYYVGAASDPSVGPGEFVSVTANNQITGTWNLGNMASGDTITLTLFGTPLPGSLGKKLTNTALVTSTNKSDWKTSNNIDQAFYYVSGLVITKTSNITSAYVGEHFTFNIDVLNASLVNAASGVRVTDVFSDVVDIVSASYNGGSFNTGNSMSYYIGTLNPGVTGNFEVIVRGNDTVPITTTFSNQATVLSSEVVRSSEEITVTLIPAADLQVTKTGDTTADLPPGETISYTISIQNIGSITATNIIITDTLSSNLEYLNFYDNGLGMTKTITSTLEHAWVLSDTLLAGETVSFKVGARVRDDAAFPDTVTNTAQAATSALEKWLANNIDDYENDVAEVVSPADMSIVLTREPAQNNVGGTFTFKITVENNGGAAASNVQVVDGFPGVLDLVSVVTSKGTATVNSSARTVTTNLGTLSAGGSATITIVARVNSSADQTRTYTHTSDMTWTPNMERTSNSVKYRIVVGSTLPGTGGSSPEAPAGQNQYQAVILLSGLVAVILTLGLWGRKRFSRSTKITMIAALFLAAAVSISACSLAQKTQEVKPTEGLNKLSGDKPGAVVTPTYQMNPTERAIVNNDIELGDYLPTPTPDRLPDYPIPTPSVTPSVGLDGGEADPSPAVRLVIPKLGIDAEVKYVPYSGQSWLIGGLRQEIAWMGDTSWPGLGGNTALAGHVDLFDGSDGPFRHLYDLAPGDEMQVYTQRNIYTYRVREEVTVEDTDMSILDPTEAPQLTLITCTGWDEDLRLYIQRLVVYADLVEVKPVRGSGS